MRRFSNPKCFAAAAYMIVCTWPLNRHLNGVLIAFAHKRPARKIRRPSFHPLIHGRTIGAKVVRHARYTAFQMAEVSITRELFAAILRRIRRLIEPFYILCNGIVSNPRHSEIISWRINPSIYRIPS